ncbi:hypothetical protein [Flavobacterium sp.]|uniref:hypothetical protein n=1 Tax=Flavobacterium sp. TaxID=239 RepID=UPI00391DAEF5
MFKAIRTSKATKIFIYYLSIMMFLEFTQPMNLYALTEGPSQPEFNSFTPIGTSDMVDLASGDFNYNIPIMDVGGYPINLAYNSGVTMDQESSWVGLGWNLNVGQINRNVRGIPDDFKGDVIKNENNLKRNLTVGLSGYINPQVIGVLDNVPVSVGGGMNVQYNNYHGLSAVPSYGVSFKLSESVSVGMQLSSSNETGASVTPNVSLSHKSSSENGKLNFIGTLSPGITYNSRQGLSSFNLSSSVGITKFFNKGGGANVGSSGSGSISFVNNTFTPSKRLAFKNNNITFSMSGGPNLWGAHIEGSISAFASVQTLKDKIKNDAAYGYEFTEYASKEDLLDFNREKELPMVTKNTLVLPVTNYTYDILSVQGQGVGGTVRPFRGQVGFVYDPLVNDISSSKSMGVEIEGGAGGHFGASKRHSNSNSYTGIWNTVATPFFKEKVSGNNRNYERVYYKNVGETRTDQEYHDLFTSKLGGYSPITLSLDVNKQASNNYFRKTVSDNTASLELSNTILQPIKRNEREKRNQITQKISKSEISRYNLQSVITPNFYARPHHTAGYIITDENGNRNIYGVTAYNNVKDEVTFAINEGQQIDYQKGLVNYYYGQNSTSNISGIDNYFNRISTPAFAHTYLVSSILSSDYEDLTRNGPTDDDLGSYTKFTYRTIPNYKWRVPFGEYKASYNEGFKTDSRDQKASYLYGEKELKYVTTIVTKTHVAFIDLQDRKDGYGVKDKNGGFPNDLNNCPRMQSIKSIRLYSKPEVINSAGVVFDPALSGNAIKPIKTAHFEYDYSLCPGIDNNRDNYNNSNGLAGKLTLKKVYFTYKSSNMGKYAAYKFNYEQTDPNNDSNPRYNPKNYDVWGNFMENNSYTGSTPNPTETSPQEFPYVNQNNDQQQDTWSSAWSLTSIELPSGGKIKLAYESDDYKYVQNKRALQMFKVAGVSNEYEYFDVERNKLYGGVPEAKFVVVKLNEEDQDANFNEDVIRQKYIGELEGKPIYFNFLLNMTSDKSDYVSGYFEMDEEAKVRRHSGVNYLFVPMKHLNREGKVGNGSNKINPITLAGLFFGRSNLHYQVYDVDFSPNSVNVVDIGWSILSNMGAMVEIFIGPNGRLIQNFDTAQRFDKNKSWIRLQEPTGSKMGGGCRIKKIEMFDAWDEILSISPSSDDIQRYKKKYGQEYNYSLEDGTSSGVATYEPNVCKENPLVQPFYHKPEKMAAAVYQEKPFGESFFPSPTVTYSKVTVKNITAADDDNGTDGDNNRKTRSGTVVTNHYTSYDFPTKTDFTPLVNRISQIYRSNENQVFQNIIKGMLGLKVTVNVDLTMTQGFVIETNDMNGKVKKQEVFNKGGDAISSVEYIYSTEENDRSTLNSKLTTIKKNGDITNEHAIGMHYDVVNDFRESYSNMNVFGKNVNVDVLPLGPIPVVIGMGIPERSKHTQILRTAVTTKVIHKTGILVEKIAKDLGSTVKTKNLAWDAETGQVLLTETINEFDDNYYTFNFPAYWYYENMGMASENIDITGVFKHIPMPNTGADKYFQVYGLLTGQQIKKYLKPGDEILFNQSNNFRFWVTGYDSSGNGVSLIRASGQKVNNLNFISLNPYQISKSFRVIRSANKNNQMSSMASITLMKNPLLDYSTTVPTVKTSIKDSFDKTNVNDPRIINSSAIEYKEIWESQCENGLPEPNQTNVNPYLYNIKGEWRPVKSYAYLTSRNATNNSNIRKSGYYVKFNPFYKLNDVATTWEIDSLNWTFASAVTKYNPYGVELENRDALKRYSAAQYGYKYKLPVAVGSNAKYKEIGFDGFEDYSLLNFLTPTTLRPHFGFSNLVNQDARVTNKKSHTGKNSIVIRPQSSVRFSRKMNGCEDSSSNTNN